MIRRNTRLRKEYLYRKSLEGKERELYEKKRAIKKALEEGKPIPTEFKKIEANLSKELGMDDASHEAPKTHIDDEYARAGIQDPVLFITTSRDPSSRLVQFAKELSIILPNAQRKNRGAHKIDEIVDACRANEITDLIIVHEHRGEPDGIIISHLPYGPTAFFALSNVVLRHELKEKDTVSQQFPHLIFHNFTTKLGERAMNILKHLFPVPKEDSKRVMTFSNEHDFVSFRHHVYRKEGRDIILKEVGPRFEMKLYQIKLGTVDIDTAENEWILRTYLNTTKKRDFL